MLSPVADSIVYPSTTSKPPTESVPAPLGPLSMDAVMSKGDVNVSKPKRNAALKSSKQHAPNMQQASGVLSPPPCSPGEAGGLGWMAKVLMLAVVVCVVAVVMTHVLLSAAPTQKAVAKSSSLSLYGAREKNTPPKSPPKPAPKTPSKPPKGSSSSSSMSSEEYFAGAQVKAAEFVEDITVFTTAASTSLSDMSSAAADAASGRNSQK